MSKAALITELEKVIYGWTSNYCEDISYELDLWFPECLAEYMAMSSWHVLEAMAKAQKEYREEFKVKEN